MLVDPKSESGQHGPSYLPEQQPADEASRGRSSGGAQSLAFLVVALVLAAGAYWLLIGRSGHSAPTPVVAERPQSLIRTGDQVTVPENSAIRSRLAIAPVAERDVRRDVVLPAMVEADPGRLVKVLPPVAGRVIALKAQLGERVTAGQPLVVIDSPDLGQAYSDYDRAKAGIDLTRRNLDRQRGLAKIGGAAEKDLQQAENDFANAEAELRRSQTRLKQIGVDADTTAKARTVTVSAPMAGSIIELDVGDGAYWNDPTASLMTIADLNTIWVTASVPESDTTLVASGQPVEVRLPAYPGEVFKGNVLFVSDVVDTDTRRTKVRIAFANPDTRLRPGMFANVTFFAPAQQLPMVPTSALILKDDLTQVFVETAPWTFEARTVDLGFQQGDQVAIKGGVRPGERVVVRGGVLLGD
jgi:cobalt-zinc-cadmium efflux system membrane fusion protein